MLKIALIGNPNSGKTTVFNGLTGSNQSVGNWPGVTVEKKSGYLKYSSFEAEIIDLPGIYSLSTLSLEEEITANYILKNDYDYIINVVDASNLERNLFLTYQLIESGTPMLIALNCMDLVQNRLDELNVLELERSLGVPVIALTASKKHGIDDLIAFIQAYRMPEIRAKFLFSDKIEESILIFEQITANRFYAIRFFEDGLKGIEFLNLPDDLKEKALELFQNEQKKYKMDFDMVLPSARYDTIMNTCSIALKKSNIHRISSTEKIDRILTNKYLGLPLFAIIMFLVFFLAFGPLGSFITRWFVYVINLFFGMIANIVEGLGMASWVTSLISNGVFGGLAAVVGFLPQLMILFFFLALLEDSGYMARAAYIMDRALRRFGLSGKSFIPMLIGFGCSVPAISSTRTLDKSEDRKITTMIIPFISCGAKAPIYGVFAGALFASHSYIIVFSMYILGLFVAISSAILFKKTILKGASANYIMELPEYRSPTIKNMWLHTWERSKGFLIKAGTILLAAFIVIWFLSYFGVVDSTFRLLDQSEIANSLLAQIGKAILPVFKPLGFTEWQSTVAILTGFVAKESVVGTLGILYGVTGNVIENGSLLFRDIQSHFTALQAYAFMTFALLSTPCIATLAAMKRELGSWKWLIFSLLYELTIAYVVSMLIYQIGGLGLGVALSYLFAFVVIIFVINMIRKWIRQKGSSCTNCSTCGLSEKCHLPKKEIEAELKEKYHDTKK
jgi:ferrous iron transport protein B